MSRRLFAAGRGMDAEASSVRPGMACRWTPTQARSAGHPSSRFFFCDEGRSCREAALFGYFLALLPKSNSPVGEKPRLHSAKAEQRVMRLGDFSATSDGAGFPLSGE